MRSIVFALVTATPLGALVACRGQVLDVGSTTLESDAAPTDADTSFDDDPSAIPEGFFVDGHPCSATLTGDAMRWPIWTFGLEGNCPEIGAVTVTVTSRADLAYPQSCGVATTVSLYEPVTPAGDAYAPSIDYGADVTDGHCSIVRGPSLALPSELLAFRAKVVRSDDRSRSRQVTYYAEAHADGATPTPPPPPPAFEGGICCDAGR